MENISDLKLDYDQKVRKQGSTIYIDSWSTNQCLPVWKLNGKQYNCLLNQYPKEWLVNEIERDELLKYDLAKLRSIEPWWKLILGNKALLPLLWSLYPNHPNLLPAYYDDPRKVLDNTGYKNEVTKKNNKWISKPLFGREGLGLFTSDNYTNFDAFMRASEGNFGKDKKTGITLGQSVYQLYKKLPEVQGRVIQTSSWIISGMAAGVNFREGKAGTHFSDKSPFLPHYVKQVGKGKQTYRFSYTNEQRRLVNRLYGRFGFDHYRLLSSKNPNIGVTHATIPSQPSNGRYEKFEAKSWRLWPSYKAESASGYFITYSKELDTLQDLNYKKNQLNRLLTLQCFVSEGNSRYTRFAYLPGDQQNKSKQKKYNELYTWSAALAHKDIDAYVKKNPKFIKQRRITKFGSLASQTLDYKGEEQGKWYSVDSHGRIRTHSYSTAALYVSVRSTRSSSMRSSTRSSRGRGTSS